MSGLVSSDESKRLEYFSLARVIDDFQEEQCGVFSESRRESTDLRAELDGNAILCVFSSG